MIKNKCKKIITVSILLVMMATMFSVNVFAGGSVSNVNNEDSEDSNGKTYLTICDYINYKFHKDAGRLIIGKDVDSFKVDYLENDSIDKDEIKIVIIKRDANKINVGAFKGCKNLERVIIENGATEIGYEAFADCTNLKEVKIPRSVTSLSDAFDGCTNLVSINVDAENPEYKSIDGVLFSKDGTKLLKYPHGKEETNYIIHDNVAEICDTVFMGCTNLKEIKIPSSVMKIGENAFEDCKNLERVVIENGVKIIDNYAFLNCISLKEIKIPSSVTVIGDMAFLNCENLERIIIENSATEINSTAFSACIKLKEICVPSDYEGDSLCETKVKKVGI